jgi:hypothetical protein
MSSRSADFYKLLDVGEYATQAEIKQAYFKKARENHPDLHPNDPTATKRFQEISEAFNVLKDPSTRARYDAGDQYGPATGHYEQEAHAVFREVWQEMGLGDIEKYFDGVKKDAVVAFDAAGKGDLSLVQKFATQHPGLIVSVMVPLALVLRNPGLVMTAARFGLMLPLLGACGGHFLRVSSSSSSQKSVAVAPPPSPSAFSAHSNSLPPTPTLPHTPHCFSLQIPPLSRVVGIIFLGMAGDIRCSTATVRSGE